MKALTASDALAVTLWGEAAPTQGAMFAPEVGTAAPRPAPLSCPACSKAGPHACQGHALQLSAPSPGESATLTIVHPRTTEPS